VGSKLVLSEYLGKVSVGVGRQQAGWSTLYDMAITQDDDHVTVAYRAEPMCNDEDRAVNELLLDDVVNDTIGLDVDGSCCLVHHQHLTPSQQGACQAEQLPLTDAEVLSGIGHGRLQLAWQTAHELLQLSDPQHVPQLRVVDRLTGVQVEPDAAGKQDRILRDDGQAGT